MQFNCHVFTGFFVTDVQLFKSNQIKYVSERVQVFPSSGPRSSLTTRQHSNLRKDDFVFALNVAVAIGVGSAPSRLHTLNATGLGIFSRVCQKVFWEIYEIIF